MSRAEISLYIYIQPRVSCHLGQFSLPGAWSHPFDVSTAPFHVPGGTTVGVPSMMTGWSQYIALYPGFGALKLPYKNDVLRQADAFYMLILLPDSGTLSLADLYDNAVSTPEFIRKHTPVEEVPVGRFMVPKFKFTFGFEASSDMQKLGVTRAFSGGDFSSMVSGGDGHGRVSISRVYHKAAIEVDEQGTVAAAATIVLLDGTALEEREPPHLVDFVADWPFLFAVVEERTGAVLFLGHVVNPLAG
ncbi:putative serpin-Z12 [Triticum dicoccoides]|uniref:putative serpin-Z12 n=1 Tax=Triticum dicoccoides TaxID=85692 RepID=UPI001890F2A7|nr:putative serpin-Z12 [Triticum dicoccoides]XP_044414582.1 putative serpin-Z12 [Triticum aestivum]